MDGFIFRAIDKFGCHLINILLGNDRNGIPRFNRDKALKYIALAEEAGQAISDEESKKIFLDDFNGGDWKELR